MRIYLASNWQSQARIRAMREVIEGLGHEVVSGWLDETQTAQSLASTTPEEARIFAYRDMGEIMSCDLLIIDTQEESTSGGREVEYGVAMALGKPMWLVGPNRNIFHSIPRRQYDTWEEVIGDLEE